MGPASEVPRVRRLQLQPLSPRLIPLVSFLQTPARLLPSVDTGRVPYLTISLLPPSPSPTSPIANATCRNSRYADHVGIHYVLCQKLRQFPYEDIEFFLPQLCHLIISVHNESMALEEFLLDLCEESVTAALLVRVVILNLTFDMECASHRVMGFTFMDLTVSKKTDNRMRRLSGCFRRTSTIYRRIHHPTRFRPVAVYTTRFSTSSLGSPIPLGTRRLPKMFFLSRSSLASCLLVLRCQCFRSGLVLSQSPRPASHNLSPMIRRNRRRTQSLPGHVRSQQGIRDRGVLETVLVPSVRRTLKDLGTLHLSLPVAVLNRRQ